MDFSDAWWGVFSFDLIHNSLVIVRKACENDLHLILMIIRFPKDCKLIKLGHHALYVLINCFVALGIDLKLILELFEMATARLRIRSSQLLPDLRGGGGARDHRLNGR